MKLSKETVAKRYSKALFAVSVEREEVEVNYAHVQTLETIFTDNPDLGNILSDVRLDGAQKEALFKVLQDAFSGTMHAFLAIVHQYQRMATLPAILKGYEELYWQAKGFATGTVTAVVPLGTEQQAQLEARVAETFGYEHVRLTQKIDETLIGGAVVEVNHRIIDGSLKRKLANIHAELLK